MNHTEPTPSSPPLAVSVRGLRKSYGDHVVLDGIDLDVPEGRILALLGPNGAGKTTIIHLLTTAQRPDAGELRVAGHDPVTAGVAVREVIGVTGQFSAVDGLMTGRENLQLMARLHHLPGSRRGGDSEARIDELLATFDLVDAADRPASTYSGGMRRRLDLAMSLMGDPRVLFLDEPTTGLDPASRRHLWEVVRRLARAGTTIFLTTQYLEEADQLADEIAVLDGGRIVARGTAAELKSLVGGGHVTVALPDAASLDRAVAAFPAAKRDDQARTLVIPTAADVRGLRTLLETFEQHGLDIETFDLHQPDLDDVFLSVTGTTGATR